MNIKFDALNRYEVPSITLCNPGSVYEDGTLTNIVGILTDTSDEELVANFNTMSEFNFCITRVTREDEDDNHHTHKMYNSVQNRRMIFVDGIGYFVISDTNDDYGDDGVWRKSVKARSCEAEIENKMIPFVDDGTYLFTDLLSKIMSSIPVWTVAYVDSTVASKYRTFEDVDVHLNCLSFMLSNMQDAYECIFSFDIINRTVSVYDQNNYVLDTDIHISNRDLVRTMGITENSNDLYTAVTVLGGDNITISSLNPIGTNTIYRFDYYLDWMSDSLRESVQIWQNDIEAVKPTYYSLNLSYYQALEERYNHRAELDRIDIQLTMYQRCRDNIVAETNIDLVPSYNEVIVANGGTPIEIYDEITEVLAEIDRLISECQTERYGVETLYNSADDRVNSLRAEISHIQQSLDPERIFSDSDYDELQNYIYEGSYNDDYVVITDVMSFTERFEQMKVLYDRAEQRLQKVSCPTQEFTADVENFLAIKDYEDWHRQLETGCLVNVELSDNDVAKLFLSNITIGYEDGSLKLTFGNRFNKFDPKTLFDNVLGDISKSSNSIGYIKDILYPIKSGEFNQMQQAMQTSRDLTMSSALASTGERVVIDGSGYTGKTLLENGEYDPRQIKITGKTMVFTDDSWQSCKVAIGELIFGNGETAYGINAATIIGDIIMGSNLRIVDSNGNDLMTVVDGRIQTQVADIGNIVTQIEQLANSVEIRVSTLENAEIDSVTTTTGYTFNADGLTIHKSGEEMQNLLDNTGMYVTRSGEDILTANNEGVTAINLHARQYMIVGANSRFEDYGSGSTINRTACYYIGE